MNIESMDYFKKVAEIKSISKVSQQSHISQSALSQIIHKLEESIGHKLFIRSNKGVELTEMGRVVYDYADIILKTYHKMIAELESVAKDQHHVIINSTWAISHYALPSLLVEMKKEHPYVNYELRSNRSEMIIENVKNGLVDFGIIYGDPYSESLVSIPFGEDEIVLVANKDYDVPDEIKVDDISSYHLINFKHGCYYTDVKQSIMNLLQSSNNQDYEFNPLLSLDSLSAVKSSVSEGLGISFLPYTSVKNELNEGRFKRIKIENINLKLKVNIVRLKQIKPDILNVINVFLKLGPKLIFK